MEETINLKDLFHILRKRIAMILIITLGAAIVLLLASFYDTDVSDFNTNSCKPEEARRSSYSVQ